jgi:hypothetical protein
MCLYLEVTAEILSPRLVRPWGFHHYRSLQDEPSRVQYVVICRFSAFWKRPPEKSLKTKKKS